MTAAAVLDEARAAGVQLYATPEGKLHWRCPRPLPEAIHQLLVAHKTELLALLGGEHAQQAAEADRQLAGLRAELARIEGDHYRGRFPPAVANVAADGLAIAEGYVANREKEAARGWDPLELLRELAASLPRIVRGDRRRWPAPGSPAELEGDGS